MKKYWLLPATFFVVAFFVPTMVAHAKVGDSCAGKKDGSPATGSCITKGSGCTSFLLGYSGCESSETCCGDSVAAPPVTPAAASPAASSPALKCLPGQNCFNFPDEIKADIPVLVKRVVTGALSIVGAIFFVMFLWGGVRYLTAGGSAEDVKKARQILTNAVIGMVIVALAYVLTYNVIYALTNAVKK